MSRPVRHAVAVTLLALAGLVIAVALGILVSRTASQSVALGGADLGSRTTLVVTTTPAPPRTTPARTTRPTTTRTTPATTTVRPATTAAPVPATPTTTATTPRTDDHGGSREHSGGHDGDD